LTRRQVKRPSKRRTAKPPTTPPTTGPTAIVLFDGLSVDSGGAVVKDCGEVVVIKEENTEPSEVTSEFVVIAVGGGVVTTGISVVVDVDVSVEVSEYNEGVGVDVGIEGVKEEDDEIEVEVEEHEDPKRVVNTVTGTSTVCVAGTITVVGTPGEVINEVVIVGRQGEDGSTCAQVLITRVDTESDPVEMDSVDVVTKL